MTKGSEPVAAKHFQMGLMPNGKSTLSKLTLLEGTTVQWAPTCGDMPKMAMGAMYLGAEAAQTGAETVASQQFIGEFAGPAATLAIGRDAADPDPLVMVLNGPMMMGFRCPLATLEQFAADLQQAIASRPPGQEPARPPQKH